MGADEGKENMNSETFKNVLSGYPVWKVKENLSNTCLLIQSRTLGFASLSSLEFLLAVR